MRFLAMAVAFGAMGASSFPPSQSTPIPATAIVSQPPQATATSREGLRRRNRDQAAAAAACASGETSTALRRLTSEKKAATGLVDLWMRLAPDGSPPRYFEAIGQPDQEAAVVVTRALGTCRWRPQDGKDIPPDA